MVHGTGRGAHIRKCGTSPVLPIVAWANTGLQTPGGNSATAKFQWHLCFQGSCPYFTSWTSFLRWICCLLHEAAAFLIQLQVEFTLPQVLFGQFGPAPLFVWLRLQRLFGQFSFCPISGSPATVPVRTLLIPAVSALLPLTCLVRRRWA